MKATIEMHRLGGTVLQAYDEEDELIFAMSLHFGIGISYEQKTLAQNLHRKALVTNLERLGYTVENA